MEARAIEHGNAPGASAGARAPARYSGTQAGRVLDALQKREELWRPEQRLWFALFRQAVVEARRHRDARAFFAKGLYLAVTDALGIERDTAYRLALVLGAEYGFAPAAPPQELRKREPLPALPPRDKDLIYGPRRAQKRAPLLRERILAAIPTRGMGIATAELRTIVEAPEPEAFRRTLIALHDDGEVVPMVSDRVDTPVRWRRATKNGGG